MARTRYGARRRPVEERSDPLAALGSFLTDLGMGTANTNTSLLD